VGKKTRKRYEAKGEFKEEIPYESYDLKLEGGTH
jgi:hypothetical protein